MSQMKAPQAFCRWCGGTLAPEPLLALRNMPAGAQTLPRADELAADVGVDLYIHRCEDCDLVQTVGEPVGYYRDVIRANAFSPAMKTFRQTQLADWVQRHGLHGRPVLEVGSGRGEFLDLLREAGAQPWGTEHGAEAAQAAQAQGHPLWQVYPGEDALPAEPRFAAWASFNFMEHWPEPRRLLRAVRAQLSEGAVGLVEVPNFDMILKHRLMSEFIADHIFYFTEATLRRCLETAGFEVLSVQPIWYGYILSAEVRRRSAPALGDFSSSLARVREQLHAFADQHAAAGVAVWGAGHQALATLALAELGPKLRYVVDSAPFKQGRYTPVTHLPIRPPEALRSEPVGALIVMAAGYSDEVAGLLRQHYAPTPALAILREDGLELA